MIPEGRAAAAQAARARSLCGGMTHENNENKPSGLFLIELSCGPFKQLS